MKKIIIPLMALMIVVGCEEEPVNKALLDTNIINISGNWNIEKVWQNEVDITENFDFSSFNLTLNYSGETPSTFSITADHDIPFITALSDGNWGFDNLTYPTLIRFVQGDTTVTELAKPLFPVGNTRIMMEFDLGCSENVYVYQLSKQD